MMTDKQTVTGSVTVCFFLLILSIFLHQNIYIAENVWYNMIGNLDSTFINAAYGGVWL